MPKVVKLYITLILFKNMLKRGQLTIFVIVFLVIISAALFLFLLPKKNDLPIEESKSKADKLSLKSVEIQTFMKSFIENKGLICIKKIGENGGYNTVPAELSALSSSIWYYQGINLQPFLSDFEKEIKKCLDNELINNPPNLRKIFPENEINIKKELAFSVISIKDNSIKIEVKYPVVILDGNSAVNLEDFEIIFSSDLKRLFEFSTFILNSASTSDFNLCDSSVCGLENMYFSFSSIDNNIIVKGTTSLQSGDVNSDVELKFIMKRPISESFGENGKKLAVLYQDNVDLPTFGNKAESILKENLQLNEGVDYYSCELVPQFLSQINKYDSVIITGNLQYQLISLDDLSLINGCNSFNNPENKFSLKNWINNGGILWINFLSKYESEDFAVSYIGSLGYVGGAFKELESEEFFQQQEEIIANVEEKREIVKIEDIVSFDIISCPNNLTQSLVGVWSQKGLSVTEEDSIIIGTKENAKLWTRKIGKGIIVFDQFPLKDNLFNKLPYTDDLSSKEIAEKYFYNVLTYLAKFNSTVKENNIIYSGEVNKCAKFCSLDMSMGSVFKETCTNVCTLGCCTDPQGFKHNSFSLDLCVIQNGIFDINTCPSQNICEKKDPTLTSTLNEDELNELLNQND